MIETGYLGRASYRTDWTPAEPDVPPHFSTDIPKNVLDEIVSVEWQLGWVHVTYMLRGRSPVDPWVGCSWCYRPAKQSEVEWDHDRSAWVHVDPCSNTDGEVRGG